MSSRGLQLRETAALSDPVRLRYHGKASRSRTLRAFLMPWATLALVPFSQVCGYSFYPVQLGSTGFDPPPLFFFELRSFNLCSDLFTTHDANLLLHHIPKRLYRLRCGYCGNHVSTVKSLMFKKPVWDDFISKYHRDAPQIINCYGQQTAQELLLKWCFILHLNTSPLWFFKYLIHDHFPSVTVKFGEISDSWCHEVERDKLFKFACFVVLPF